MENILAPQNGTDRRLFQRIPVDFPVRFRREDGEGKGFCWDISAAGLGIFSKDRLTPKDRLDLWLQIPDQHDPLNVSGEVVWVKETQPETWRAGVVFSKIQLMALSRIFRISQAAKM